jgi:phage gp36-like protein
MSYASLDQFKVWAAGGPDGARLSDLFQSVDATDQDTMIAAALEEATAIMDGYFQRARYTVPIDHQDTEPTLSFLVKMCLDLAAGSLSIGVAVPEGIKTAYDRRIDQLTKIQGEPAFSDIGELTFVNPRMDLPGISRGA